jgi:hypothetical protein
MAPASGTTPPRPAPPRLCPAPAALSGPGLTPAPSQPVPAPGGGPSQPELTGLWEQQEGLGALIAHGDLADLYLARDGVIKLARDPADNDLIDREAHALTLLRSRVLRRYLAYLPSLAQTRRCCDPRSGQLRRANVIGRLDGFRTLAEVHAAYPDGIDPADAAWMWRRLLVAVGLAHRAGVVHAAVLPEHVLIHPAKHGLVLVDWCYSLTHGCGRVAAIPGRYRDWYPPDVLNRHAAGPDADLYLAAGCMTYLVGGRMPAPLAAFARGCLLPGRRHRPRDAWRLLAELDELLERLFGQRRFRPFTMPG